MLSQRRTPAKSSLLINHDLAFIGQVLTRSRTGLLKRGATYTLTIFPLFLFFNHSKNNVSLFIYFKDVNLSLSDFTLIIAFGKPRNCADSDTAEYHQLEISFGGRKFIHFTPFFICVELQRVEN